MNELKNTLYFPFHTFYILIDVLNSPYLTWITKIIVLIKRKGFEQKLKALILFVVTLFIVSVYDIREEVELKEDISRQNSCSSNFPYWN